MWLSKEWLNDFVDLTQVTGDELCETMSRTGLEVEQVVNYGEGLDHLVIGQVISAEPVEDSDHLQLTQVDIGGDDLVQIICGAPNCRANQKVIVALPGAILPGDFEIKKSKIRGVESNGMLCSLQELGFNDNVVPKEAQDGIFILPEDAPIGADVVEYLKLDDDLLELDLTPNRADALSMLGVAYELGAIYDQKIKQPTFDDYDSLHAGDVLNQITLEVDDALAPAYTLRLIRDVEVTTSPVWLQMRLMKSGIRPINNIVDVTNYFLLLYGQPMHSFDFDKLPSTDIRVASGEEGMTFVTLDDEERELTANDTVIYAGDTPVALAGVMGGENTEVDENTQNVLLETAIFDPERVRLTSQRLNLRSESSLRFEKWLNTTTVIESGELAAGMMAGLGEGHVVIGSVIHDTTDKEPVEVSVQNDAIRRKLGIEVSREELDHIFDRLGFEVAYGDESFTVSVPRRRWDISIEADILEEVARIYGYDRIPLTLPSGETVVGKLSPYQSFIRKTQRIAEGVGLNEVITYVLTSKEKATHLRTLHAGEFVSLIWPISEERTVLRQSMLPALIETAQYNRARQINDLAFYEVGRVFIGQGDEQLPIEKEMFSVLLSGQRLDQSWNQSKATYDFYDLKGIVEAYFEALDLQNEVSFVQDDQIDVLHPGRTALIQLDGETIGLLGQIHPTLASDYDLADETFFMELDIEAVYDVVEAHHMNYTAIPRFPASTRDIAMFVPEGVNHQMIMDVIHTFGGENLKQVALFDRYEDEKNEQQSLAYHLTFQNPARTLNDKEIDERVAEITKELKDQLKIEIR